MPNRDKLRLTPLSAQDDTEALSEGLTLGDRMPSTNSNPGSARTYFQEFRMANDDYVRIDTEADTILDALTVKYGGLTAKLRPTGICVDGVEETVFVFRTQSSKETE